MMLNLNLNRFIKFCIIGALGTIPNFVVFSLLKHIDIWIINIGWIFGIIAGMISNYILNEWWTWKDGPN